MTLIEILGIHGADDTTRLWYNVTKALEELDLCARVVPVTDVDRFIQYQINSIPALALNGSVIMEKEIPNVEDLKLLIGTYSRHDGRRRVRILVPVDFSDTSHLALRYARSLASKTDTAVHVLHVVPPAPVLSDLPGNLSVPSDLTQAQMEKAEKDMDDFLGAVSAALSKEGESVGAFDLVRRQTIGFPVEEILRYAEEQQVDMIIMGSRREKRPMEGYFGSVSMVVSERAVCPVMLLPAGSSFPTSRKLMYAVASHMVAVEPLAKLLRLSILPEAEIHFVHVRTDPDDQLAVEGMKSELVDQLFAVGEPPFSFRIQVVDARDVRSGLVRYAREQGIEVIVLLYQDHGWFLRMLKRSPIRELLRHPEIPMVLLHS
ncbi:MAG: hypothetical protein RLY31_3133 [Bacteroidota bacterium]|jgi:nucleotide-binding universal stress UspA family protein